MHQTFARSSSMASSARFARSNIPYIRNYCTRSTTKSVPVQLAHKMHQSGQKYLDVRTPEEFVAGHARGAINIPYMLQSEAGMLRNSRFLDEVATNFDKDEGIIIGCKSGRRSLMAAVDLQSAGFARVTDVSGGYSAWTEHGLPIEK